MSGPAADATDSEDRRVEIQRYSHRVIRRRREEIDICVQTLLALHHFFYFERHFIPLGVSGTFAQLLRKLAQMSGPRVFGTIDRMAKAHDLSFLGQGFLDKALDVV